MWLRNVDGTLRASTLTFYTGHLENHIAPALGSHLVSGIPRQDCRELIASARAKGLKVATVRGIVRTLSTILTQAVEDELLPANPALRIGKYLRQGDEPTAEIRPFTRDEAALIVSRPRANGFPSGIPGSSAGSGPGCAPGSCWRCTGAISTGDRATCTCDGISCKAS